MLLAFANQSIFATGVTAYEYSGEPGSDFAKPVVTVVIEGQDTAAILDTGAPYLVCSPALAESLALDSGAALVRDVRLMIRGYRVSGELHRIELKFPAQEGLPLILEATAFVPVAGQLFDIPSFLGWIGCLERMRFAIDPMTQTFYFGPLS